MSSLRILINSGIGPSKQITIIANGTQNITVPKLHDQINFTFGKEIKDHPIFGLCFNITSANLSTPLVPSPFAKPYAADQANTSPTAVMFSHKDFSIFSSDHLSSGATTKFDTYRVQFQSTPPMSSTSNSTLLTASPTSVNLA